MCVRGEGKKQGTHICDCACKERVEARSVQNIVCLLGYE